MGQISRQKKGHLNLQFTIGIVVNCKFIWHTFRRIIWHSRLQNRKFIWQSWRLETVPLPLIPLAFRFTAEESRQFSNYANSQLYLAYFSQRYLAVLAA